MSKQEESENTAVEKEDKVPCCSMHPESYLYQAIGLLFICSIGFGSYFCYDIPGALEVN